MDKEKKVIFYEEKLELFLQKVEDLKSVIVKPDTKPFGINPLEITLDTVMGGLAPTKNYPYFSVDYFYEGLKNSGDILNGSVDAIHFLTWVLTCMLQERFFLSETDRAFSNLEAIMNNKWSFKIKFESQSEKLFVVNLYPYERSFVLYKLPFLLQQNNVKQISQKVDEPTSDFHQMMDDLTKKEKDISDKLKEYQIKADEMAKFIKTQETDLNFVGLSKAFQKMKKEKKETKNAIRIWLIVFFILLCAIPTFSICLYAEAEDFKWFRVVPLITLEVICLYVFRLFYQQFLSVKSELLQLDLRVNLCAFIEGYMEFKGKHKDDTSHLFEQLIFSNIISDEKKVPSTIDGLDTLAKLISEIKK